MLFGVYLDSTYELDFDDPSEFCYIEGSLGGIGHLAIVGGHKWKDAFPDAEQKVFKLERPKHA